MKLKHKYLFVLLLVQLHFNASGQGDYPESNNHDSEQQQLEWCFMYSNLFGYNISYIANPRLYQKVGQWLGTPYRYSGNSREGIDCSGFVCELYRDCYDMVLAGNTKDIFKNVKPLLRTELREGDLVFFRIHKGRISHVGIYLGNNKFAHASLQKGVIISDLDDPYYDKYFYKGGRISS
jgi:murein DD-endopeptidase / murein LD-carboxypeptidase